jgi:tetratricopeptide (TPR) repeat protein
MRVIRLVTTIWLVSAIGLVLAPMAVQPADAQAGRTRFQELYSAGNYSAALVEAQKNEAATKRRGTDNIGYVSALNDLARAHYQLGHYAEAAKIFQRVVNTLQEHIPNFTSRRST